MAYWRLQNKNTIPAIRLNRVAWQPGQGGLLALATDNGGKLVGTGLVNNDIVEFGAGTGRMVHLAWSPAGDLLATWGHRAIIWNSNGSYNQELQVPIPGPHIRLVAPMFSNDGSFIVISYDDMIGLGPWFHGQFNKFDTSTGTLHQTLRIPLSMFKHIPMWKDGLEMFSQGVNNTINLWRIGQEEPLQTVTSPGSKVTQMTFNPKTNILAFTLASAPTSVSLWKTDTPDRAVSVLTGHDAPVVTILWQSDHSDILAVVDVLGGVRIWDTTLRTTLHQYNVLLTYPGRWIRASVSPNGRFLAVAGGLGEVKIVKFDTGDTAAVCEGGGHVATVLEWSARGDKMAVGNGSNLRVFNVDMVNFGINLKAMSLMRVASLLEGNLVNGEEEARSFLTTKIPKDLVDDVVSYI